MSRPFDDPVCINSTFRPTDHQVLVYAEAKLPFMLGILVAFTAWMVLCLAAVLFFHGKYERLRIRPRSTAFLCGVMLACLLISGPLNIYAYPNLPCWLYILTVFMVIPTGGVAVISQLLVFYLLSKYQELMQSAHQDIDIMTIVDKAPVEEALSPYIPGQPPVAKGNRNSFVLMSSTLLQPQKPSSFYGLVKFLCSSGQTIPDKPSTESVDKMQVLRLLRFFLRPYGRLVILLTLLLPFVIVAFLLFASDPVFLQGCTACGPYNNTLIATMCVTAFLVVGFGSRLAWVLRKRPDQWGLANEARHIVYGAVITFLGFIADVFTEMYGNVFDFQLVLCLGVGYMLYASSLQQIFKAMAQAKAIEPFLVRASNLSSARPSAMGIPSLREILDDPKRAPAFERHLVSEFAVENLLFFQSPLEPWAR